MPTHERDTAGQGEDVYKRQVNALSEWLEVTVYKEGKVFFIRFENGGKAVAPLKQIGTCDPSKHGSLVRSIDVYKRQILQLVLPVRTYS